MGVDNKYLYSELTDKIINLAIKVHKEIGPGFKERFYEKALCYELSKNRIKYSEEKCINVRYQGIVLGSQRLDLIIEDTVIVELKVVTRISEVDIAQTVSYLKASDRKVGLVLNFAKNKLEIKRVIV